MKPILFFIILIGSILAETAQEKAVQDLRLAQQKLRSLQLEITDEAGDLIKKVETIDDKVLNQNKTLSDLLKAEENVAGEQRQLKNELARRKGEFEYTLSSLRSFGSGMKDRIHPAEKQDFGNKLKKRLELANTAGDNLVAEIERRLFMLHLSADRLQAVSGGQRFDGSAVTEGNVIEEGKFAIAGPLGYFASNDNEVLGFTSITTAEGVDYPNLALLKEGGESISELVNSGSSSVPVDASMGKAIQVARVKKSFSDYLQGGGVVGYGILALGLLAILIAIWKVIEISRFPIPNRTKLNYILDDLLSGDSENAHSKAQEFQGLGGKMVAAGVTYFYDKRRILEDALLEKLGMIQPRLERYLPFLALVAAAAPMMGLLGTVLGIMKTFAMMSIGGSGDSKSFSAGISEALITTAMGLIVAIPVIIIHGMLKSLAKSKFGQAEGVALSMLNGTTELEDAGGKKPSHEEPEDLDLDEAELI